MRRNSENESAEPSFDANASPRAFPSYLVFALLALVVVVGFVTAWCFKRVETNYSRLISTTTEDLRYFQEMAYDSEMMLETLLRLPYTDSSDKRTELLSSLALRNNNASLVHQHLARDATDTETRASLTQLVAKRLALQEAANAFVSNAQNKPALDPDGQLWQQVLAALGDYRQCCQDVGKRFEAASLNAKEQAKREIDRLRFVFFALGFCPIIICLLLLLSLVYLLRTMPLESDLS